ncbi:putative Serine phosphatase RsbU, regulator of sigma subunit [Streptomyces misionensis JCM 4497]
MAEQPARLHVRLHQGGRLLHRPRRPGGPVEPARRTALRHPRRPRRRHGPHRGVHRPRPARTGPAQDGGDPGRARVDRRGALPDAGPAGRRARHRRPGRGLCDAHADRRGGEGGRLHRRGRAHPAPDRDRPRRVPGDIRTIPLRLPAHRHRPAGAPRQPAVRLRLRRQPGRTPGQGCPRLPAARRGRTGLGDAAPGAGDRRARHRHAHHRERPRLRGAPPLVRQPLPRAQRQRPAHRRRLARHRRHRPPRRRPGGRRRPPQPGPAQPGRGPDRQLPRPGDHRARTPRRRRPRLLRPGHRRPLRGAADRRRDTARHGRRQRRTTARRRRQRRRRRASVRLHRGRLGRRRPPLPLQLALRQRPAHRPAPLRAARGGQPGAVHAGRADGRPRHGRRTRPVRADQGQRAVRGAGPGPGGGTGRARRGLHRQRAPVPPGARTGVDPAALPAAARRPRGVRPGHRLPLSARERGDRGRRRLVRRHRTPRPPHGVGGRRRDGPRTARRGGHGRTPHGGTHVGAARPGAGRSPVRARRDRAGPRHARRRPAGHPHGTPAPGRGPLRGVPGDVRVRRVRLGDQAVHLRQRRSSAAGAGGARRARADAGRAARHAARGGRGALRGGGGRASGGRAARAVHGRTGRVPGPPAGRGAARVRRRAHRSHTTAGGRLRPRPQHPRHPPRRGRHRAADGPGAGAARRVRRRLDAAAGAAQRGPGARARAGAAARLGARRPRRHHGAAGERAGDQRAAVRRGGDPAPAAAGPHAGVRGVGRRTGAAPAPAGAGHRRGGPGAATGAAAQRRVGVPADTAGQDGLVRAAVAGRRHRAHGPGGGAAQPVLNRRRQEGGARRLRARVPGPPKQAGGPPSGSSASRTPPSTAPHRPVTRSPVPG